LEEFYIHKSSKSYQCVALVQRESNVIPKQRMNTLAMGSSRYDSEIHMEDEDGIIPLVPNAGEKIL
jgi:hypothetical protein